MMRIASHALAKTYSNANVYGMIHVLCSSPVFDSKSYSV